MTEQQHTPEPWTDLLTRKIEAYDSEYLIGGVRPQVACRVLSEPNFQHALVRVNACAGINPDAVQDMLSSLRFALLAIESRPGLRDRFDLFTKDERAALRAAIDKAEEVPNAEDDR